MRLVLDASARLGAVRVVDDAQWLGGGSRNGICSAET